MTLDEAVLLDTAGYEVSHSQGGSHFEHLLSQSDTHFKFFDDVSCQGKAVIKRYLDLFDHDLGQHAGKVPLLLLFDILVHEIVICNVIKYNETTLVALHLDLKPLNLKVLLLGVPFVDRMLGWHILVVLFVLTRVHSACDDFHQTYSLLGSHISDTD